MSKKIVVSGINLVDGGALSVYYDFLDSVIESENYKRNDYIILVSQKELFKKYKDKLKIIEFPKSKKSWILRIYYEYYYFYRLSKQIKPDIWLSMHDITPNVIAKKRFVYCHNPSPFYKMPFSKIKYGWKYYAFSKFYKYLYKINIKKNTSIIVQQQWMANEFKKMFGVNKIIVAHPSISAEKINDFKYNQDNVFKFIYPSFPRVYKNFELLCEATKKLLKDNPELKFKVLVTLGGNENNYASMLLNKYKHVSNLEFIGLIDRSKLFELYGKMDCLIFISKLETWGMPISEFEFTNKKIIASKLPYAYETVGSYSNATFIDVNSVEDLEEKMKQAILTKSFKNINRQEKSSNYLYANNWKKLINIIQNYD